MTAPLGNQLVVSLESPTRYPLWINDHRQLSIRPEPTTIANLRHCELYRDYGKWRFFRKRSSDSLNIGLEPGITR